MLIMAFLDWAPLLKPTMLSLFQLRSINKYHGGTSYVTTSSSLIVPLWCHLITFPFWKRPYSPFENNAGRMDLRTDGRTCVVASKNSLAKKAFDEFKGFLFDIVVGMIERKLSLRGWFTRQHLRAARHHCHDCGNILWGSRLFTLKKLI